MKFLNPYLRATPHSAAGSAAINKKYKYVIAYENETALPAHSRHQRGDLPVEMPQNRCPWQFAAA